MKILLLADDLSVCDDRIAPPPTHEPADLGALLDRASVLVESGGVLLLAGHWATEYLEITRGVALLTGTTGTEVTTGDWRARVADPEGDPWIRWTHTTSGHVIWTADHDLMEVAGRSTPLIDEQPAVTAAHMYRWWRCTGHSWTGTPGMTGNSLLRDTWAEGKHQPRWGLSREWPLTGQPEAPYSPLQWSREASTDRPHVHGYDANKAYLSALSCVEVAGDDLQHHQGTVFDRGRGGMWRVELEPWPDALLPDPAGYGTVLPDGSRWLTTQTMTLIENLCEEGRHGGYAVRESWTAPARRVHRSWAYTLRQIVQNGEPVYAQAAKRVYAETYGMWVRKGRVYRPDWHYATIAMARVNLWRKIDRYGRESNMWPLRVETDAVFYDSAEENWAAAAPESMSLDPTGSRLGAFKEVS